MKVAFDVCFSFVLVMKDTIQMKSFLVLGVLLAFTTPAIASLQVGGANYLGRIYDAEPASPGDEAEYINDLTTLGANAPKTLVGGAYYNRLNSVLPGPFVTAVDDGGVRVNTGNTILLTEVFHYILGKYDGPNWGDEVWYFPNGITGLVELPAEYGSNPTNPKGPFGLSHISAYNVVAGTVPEPISMIVWGGLAMAPTCVIRRRLKK